MKKYLIVILVWCCALTLNAQKLHVAGGSPEFFLNHTVAPQETFYSVGRLYNVSPRSLATFNGLSLEKGLNIDQKIKIPLDRNNFSQTAVKSVLDFYVPLYHTVKQGETLYRISQTYNKVPLDQLKAWNGMTSETVSTGADLVVGYLKVDKNQSAFAQQSTQEPVERGVADAAQEKKPTQERVLPQTAETKVAAEDTALGKPAQTGAGTQPAQTAPEAATGSPASSGEGFFKSYYLPSSFNQKSGMAAAFKSTSGWQDGKYYCFMNEAPAGTIVKITDPSTGKAIYARVLDAIPDIRQNKGLLIIISNAGVDALGKGEEPFEASVNYSL